MEEKEVIEQLETENEALRKELTEKAMIPTKSANDVQYFTNIDGIYAKDAAGRAAVEELRTLVTEYIGDYSTTERKIGKWIDGSDLYQRTFEVTASSVNGWNDNVLGTSGIKIVDVQGFMYGLYEGVYVSKPLVYFRNTTDYITFIYDSDVNVYIMDPAVSTSPMPTLTITIKYTKPSAQANLMQTPISTEEEVSETPTTVEEDDMR